MGMFGNLFGQRDKRQGRQQMQQAGGIASGVAGEAAPLGRQYDTGAAQSMGANAGEYMRNAAASAGEQATTAATGATQAATRAARTGGLNKGQAALTGGQQAGDVFRGAQQAGVQNYMAGTGQIAGQGAEMAGRQLGAAQIKAGIGGQQMQAGQQQQQGTLGAIGGALGFLSDENAKENIRPAPDLRAMLEKVKPVAFDYKDGEADKVGVIAQDLEKGPLEGAVVDTPEGKVIDGAQLTGANTAMIKSLYDRVRALEGAS